MLAKKELRERFKVIRLDAYDTEAAFKFRDDFVKKTNVKKWQIVASYFPVGSEADVSLLNKKLLEIGCDVCLPCIDGESLIFRKWNLQSKMTDDRFPEPIDGDIVELHEIDIFIVPLLAFDKKNYRLGYGGGYYDRVLKHSEAQKVGIAYQAQLSHSIPHEEHDVPLDMVITA